VELTGLAVLCSTKDVVCELCESKTLDVSCMLAWCCILLIYYYYTFFVRSAVSISTKVVYKKIKKDDKYVFLSVGREEITPEVFSVFRAVKFQKKARSKSAVAT
jgi:hypothetical protein